jgi:hypothetical protein
MDSLICGNRWSDAAGLCLCRKDEDFREGYSGRGLKVEALRARAFRTDGRVAGLLLCIGLQNALSLKGKKIMTALAWVVDGRAG